MEDNYLKLQHNDVYYMEIVSDKIVINDNYSGFIIYDFSLNEISKVQLHNEFGIYSSFKEERTLVCYCPDDKCIVILDINNLVSSIIDLQDDYDSKTFSNLYGSIQEKTILVCYSGEKVMLDLKHKILKKIDSAYLASNYPMLITISSAIDIAKLIRIDYNRNIAFVKKDKNCISVIDLETMESIVDYGVDSDFIKVDYLNHIFIVLYEYKADILGKSEKKSILPEKNYSFIEAKLFLKRNITCIVLLSSSEENTEYSRIDIYEKICKYS